jgi:hypothetical protein
MKITTKVALAAPVVAGIVGGLGLGAMAPSAHADSQIVGIRGDQSAVGYEMELSQDGWTMTPGQARQNAANVCGQRMLGVSETQIIHALENGNVPTFDIAFDLAYGAEFHFCPAYLPSPSSQDGGTSL